LYGVWFQVLEGDKHAGGIKSLQKMSHYPQGIVRRTRGGGVGVGDREKSKSYQEKVKEE